MDFKAERKRVMKQVRREGLERPLHQKLVDLARLERGYPQRFNSYRVAATNLQDERTE